MKASHGSLHLSHKAVQPEAGHLRGEPVVVPTLDYDRHCSDRSLLKRFLCFNVIVILVMLDFAL